MIYTSSLERLLSKLLNENLLAVPVLCIILRLELGQNEKWFSLLSFKISLGLIFLGLPRLRSFPLEIGI
jgi:hypothetical protein